MRIEWIIVLIGLLAFIANFFTPDIAMILAIILAITSVTALVDALRSRYNR